MKPLTKPNVKAALTAALKKIAKNPDRKKVWIEVAATGVCPGLGDPESTRHTAVVEKLKEFYPKSSETWATAPTASNPKRTEFYFIFRR